MKGPWAEVARWINRGTSGDGFRFRKVFWNREPIPGSFQEGAQVALFHKFETLVKSWNDICQSLSKVLGPSKAFPNLQGLGAQKKVYTVNLDPAVRNLAYPVTLDSYRWLMTGMWNWGRGQDMCQESRVVWDVKISRETYCNPAETWELSLRPQGPDFLYGLSKHIWNTSTFHHKVASVKVQTCWIKEYWYPRLRKLQGGDETFWFGTKRCHHDPWIACFVVLFFGSPARWKMVLCRLVLCRLCGLDSMLIHQNLERLAMKFQNNNGNPNDHVS